MNIVNKLTLRHLRLNRGRTLITLAGIVLSVAMVCAVAGFMASLQDVLRRQIVEYRGGEWHITYGHVAPEDVERIAAEGGYFDSYYLHAFEEEDGTAYVNLYLHLEKPDRNYRKISDAIAEKYGLTAAGRNSELLALDGVIAEDNIFMAFLWIAAVLIVIIVGGSVTVIANAFNISAAERVRQFGLLKSAGATGRQLGRSVLFEALILTAAAIPLGIALGLALQAAGVAILNTALVELLGFANRFRVVFLPVILYVSSGVAVITVLLSAWSPARRAAKTPAVDAIRQSRNVRVRKRELKVSRLTGKVFGFEGTLAAKSLKRSKGKYRAAVAALTVSVVLFVGVSSFIGMMNKMVSMNYGGFNYDVIGYASADIEKQDEIESLLSAWPGAEVTVARYANTAITVPDGFYGKEYYSQYGLYTDMIVLLVSAPDDLFIRYAPIGTDRINGVLVNTSGTIRQDGKLKEFRPYNFQKGLELVLDGLYGEGKGLATVTLSAEVRKIPEFIEAMSYGHPCIVFIPDSDFRAIMPVFSNADGKQAANAHFNVSVDAADRFVEAMTGMEELVLINIQRERRGNQSLMLVISLFGYGFIAILSLIAVTSVVATISTGMALRRREFAMLHSAGMTDKGLNKMLNLESLLYGVKSLLIGLPLGIGVSLLIWIALLGTAVFDYQFPWLAVLISAAAVLMLTFATMRYGRSKFKKVSIVEAIRDEA